MSAFKVGITTTRDRAGSLSNTAREHGLAPVILPCIEVAAAPDDDLAAIRSRAMHVDWILVTSPRAVATLWADGGMPDARVATVGPTTAEAVTHAGGRVAIVGDSGARDVVASLIDESPGSVLFPHAAGADVSSVEMLERSGADVTAHVVYETRPIAPGPDPVDAVAFGSPSAVAGWCLSRGLEAATLAAIGETTAAALEERGHRPGVVSPRPDFATLMSLLAGHLRERSHV